MGTVTISFDKDYEQKFAIIRDRNPKLHRLATDDAKKAFVYAAIDNEVSDEELERVRNKA